MHKIGIDGARHTGNYRLNCECGGDWIGQGEQLSDTAFSPAAPIAEAIVHMRLVHGGHPCDLRFTERFGDWLQAYWERLSRQQSRAATVARAKASRGWMR